MRVYAGLATGGWSVLSVRSVPLTMSACAHTHLASTMSGQMCEQHWSFTDRNDFRPIEIAKIYLSVFNGPCCHYYLPVKQKDKKITKTNGEKRILTVAEGPLLEVPVPSAEHARTSSRSSWR